jgi:hypothetical protein
MSKKFVFECTGEPAQVCGDGYVCPACGHWHALTDDKSRGLLKAFVENTNEKLKNLIDIVSND